MNSFASAHLKIKRANRHIAEIQSLFSNFGRSNFFNLTIDKDPGTGGNFLCFEIDLFHFPFDEVAVATGDAVHNLRSCLDHLYYQVISQCGGLPSKYSRFPIFESKEKLTENLDGAVKTKQITQSVADVITHKIKPIKGNGNVWGIHIVDILDKHRVLTPLVKLTGIYDVVLEDETHARIGKSEYFITRSTRIKLDDADGRTVTVKNKGRSYVFGIFDTEPFKGQNIVAKLKNASEEFHKIIEQFESLKFES
jgi:hypothetical protein